MRYGLALVVALAIFALVFPLANRVMQRSAEIDRRLAELRDTKAYACGYLSGQHSILSRIKTAAAPIPTWCEEYRITAANNGFTAQQDGAAAMK